jgi:hypothetical protein
MRIKDVDPRLYKPLIREAVGWLGYEDEECLRIVWERFAMPDRPTNPSLELQVL